MSDENVDPSVISHALLCAERGWKGSFTLKDGEKINEAFITATDEVKNVVVVERVGERDRPPRLIYLKDVLSIEVHWA